MLLFFAIWASRCAGFRTIVGRLLWVFFFMVCYIPLYSKSLGNKDPVPKEQYLLALPLIVYGGIRVMLPSWKEFSRPGERHGYVWYYGLEDRDVSESSFCSSRNLRVLLPRVISWVTTSIAGIVYLSYR